MIDLSPPQPVVVLVLGASATDFEHLQCTLLQSMIHWHLATERDLSCLMDNSSRFDCVLVKVDGQGSELANIATLRKCNSSLPIIALGCNWEVPAVVKAMKLGATEVCEFPANVPELCCAFQRCISPEARRQTHYSELIPRAILTKLNSEEARILHLLVQGRTTKEVGATLDVSIRTVHYRKKELLRKLGVQNRSEAIELIRLSSSQYFPLDSGLPAL